MSLKSLKRIAQEHLAAMGLVAAARKASLEKEEDLPHLAQEIQLAFAKQMEPHFQDEEELVLPKLRQIKRDDLADRTLSEHIKMRLLIADMGKNPPAPLLHEFSEMLQAHINFENEVVWLALEEAFEEKDVT